ncbi:MAG TPA: hypothetical protein VNO50_04680 [Pyrinomonadaceae bacterium]|nr:hypothetical protein [Pyrinomonadaceae bacterium]
MQPHRGVLILVFGILSFVVCPFFGIAAWVMGNTDLREMAVGRMDPTGRDLTQAGRICGIVGTLLVLIPMVIIIFAALGVALFGAAAG